MYSEYQTFANGLSGDDSFKTNTKYTAILEHVTYNQGNQYIEFIKKVIFEHFPQVTFKNINDYLLLNDKYGMPLKEVFTYNDESMTCSPSSLRYVLHALLILKHIKDVNLSRMVEVGCGYGGLFLAINHFSKILNITIDNYYIIDLPEICNLITNYLKNHENNINIKYSLHSAYDYGIDIPDTNLFFISNYCFTEIDVIHRNNYINLLFPKLSNGFIIWQTCANNNLAIENVNIISKNIKEVCEEYPQTANMINKNYYVYF